MDNSGQILNLIQNVDHLIKKGHAWCALREISQISPRDLFPNDHAHLIANLYRRLNKPTLGLKTLAKTIQSESIPPSTNALLEYALCLHAVGATGEALHRFQKIDSFAHPETLIYQVHCYFSNWNYKDSIPLIEQYLKSEKIDQYQKMIARTNLVAALANCKRYEESKELAQKNIELCDQNNWIRLLINNKEVLAQNLFEENRLSEAQAVLESTSLHLVSDILIDRWFVQKWKAIIKSKVEQSPDPLIAAKEVAAKNNHWESLRDLDYYLFLVTGEKKVINKVYHGTPYQAFRDRLPSAMRHLIDQNYIINEGHGEVLDSRSGRIGNVEIFNPGKNIHKVLLSLIEDFYRPLSIGQIFCKMFPNEVFNPSSSTNRIHQLLLRTRKHFKQCNLPLEIHNDDHGYRLVLNGAFSVLKHGAEVKLDSTSIQLSKLQSTFSQTPFSTKQAEDILKASTSTATRLLNKGIKAGHLVKTGKGPKTRYCFASANQHPQLSVKSA